jgi:hypothetical protein
VTLWSPPAAPPVETALDDVRACEIAGYDMAVRELRQRLAAPDAETSGSNNHTWIERFATVTTRMYYQKVGVTHALHAAALGSKQQMEVEHMRFSITCGFPGVAHLHIQHLTTVPLVMQLRFSDRFLQTMQVTLACHTCIMLSDCQSAPKTCRGTLQHGQL